MNETLTSIRRIQDELAKLSVEPSFSQAQRVILSVIRLLDSAVDLDRAEDSFQLFNDGDGKIRANGGWFFEDELIVDRRATYKVHPKNALNIDFKAYGLRKTGKRFVSWITGVTPNFEDEPYNGGMNVGIDFVVPESHDRVIVVLTNNYVIRTLELKGNLTATYQEIFAKWAALRDFSNKREFHAILWESFDLQPLNKKFYAGISERFIALRQHLEKAGVADSQHAAYFANRLIGRIIFVWFLDHKNVIDKSRKYFDSASFPDDTAFYRDRLETLFFRVLNTPTGDREPALRDDMTPFLNGGLFEPRSTDLFGDPRLTFPKNYFDDLFSFLSGYNFTTDESTSQFQQVAIDPEMLGRIFENLLAEMTEETGEQARKAKGAFYTPREIVDYMCRESLREYLKTKLPEDEFRDQRLEQLIDRADKEFQDQDHNWRRDWKPYKETIIGALDELKVLDPACGSGAFPIGMMQLLVQVYERLETRFDPFKTKLGIIEKNLYGVDIEPMAVEIARLRAWLSIVVDEDADSRKIKPLPNLEFKFICANSLIGLDVDGEMPIDAKDHTVLADELRSIRDAYFTTGRVRDKKSLRKKYDALVNEQEGLFGESKRSKQLKTYHPFDSERSAGFFDPDFMFGVEKFDVVIGNPPYVQIQKFARTEMQKNLENERYETFAKTGDLYALFYERGLELTKPTTGLLCFITSNKWMRAGYGEKLRGYFARKNPLFLLDFGGFKVFESATVDTNILLIGNGENRNALQACHFQNDYRRGESLKDYCDSRFVELQNLSSDTWFIGSADELALKAKIERVGKPLKEWDVKIYFGIKTGFNKAFIIDQNKRDEIVAKDPRNVELIRPVLHGKNIKRYINEWEGLYIIFIPWHFPLHEDGAISGNSQEADAAFKERYPVVYSHLLQFKDGLENRNKEEVGRRYEWYALQRCASSYYKEFKKEKIVWREITATQSFCLGEESLFVVAPATFLVSEKLSNKLLLGILNSKLVLWYFSCLAHNLGESGLEWKKAKIETIPIPSSVDHHLIVADIEDLVDKIVSKSTADGSALEMAINRLVYKLYDLTDAEIKIVEGANVSER